MPVLPSGGMNPVRYGEGSTSSSAPFICEVIRGRDGVEVMVEERKVIPWMSSRFSNPFCITSTIVFSPSPLMHRSISGVCSMIIRGEKVAVGPPRTIFMWGFFFFRHCAKILMYG